MRYASGDFIYAVFTGRLATENGESPGRYLRSGITLPTREMWLKLRDDVMRYGIYNQNLQAVPPTGSISYINHATSSIHRLWPKLRFAKRAETGRVITRAVYDQ